MARYEDSTQRKNWTTTVEGLSQLREKCNTDTLELLNSIEQYNNENGIEAKPKPPGVTVEEQLEHELHCLQLMSQICVEMKYPNEVLLTAAMYFKRYFLHSSVMKTDPTKVMLVCIYIAGKCEEVPFTREKRGIDPDKLAKVCGLKESDIKELEVDVLNGIKFNLVAFHPVRPMIGFVRLIIPASSSRKVQVSVEDAAKVLIFQSLYTDCMFLYPPSQIALACVNLAIKQQKSQDLEHLYAEYIKKKFESNLENFQKSIDEIGTLIQTGSREINTVLLKAGNKKSKKCRAYIRKSDMKQSKVETKTEPVDNGNNGGVKRKHEDIDPQSQ